jgi:hypothetical protein
MAAVTLQDDVQAAVIQALMEDPNLDMGRIIDDLRGRAELRDVFRAVEVLTDAGLIEPAPEAIRRPGTLPMLFTDAGLRSLRGEQPWPPSDSGPAAEREPQAP